MSDNENRPAAWPGRAWIDGKVVILTGAAGQYRHLHIRAACCVRGAPGHDRPQRETSSRPLSTNSSPRASIAPAWYPPPATAPIREVCREIVATAVEHFGAIDVLINNAGAAGPRRTLRDIPFSEAEMRARGDDQTMLDSAMNLLAAPWNMARAAVPHMRRGGAIVNVSTIFSRTHYYGRIPYVVPKSGLNALSLGLARELGDEYGIRVNTVFPGPIESERIDTVFANMDALQGPRRQHVEGIPRSHDHAARNAGRRVRLPLPDALRRRLDHHLAGLGRVRGPVGARLRGHERHAGAGAEPLQACSWPDKRLEDLSNQVVLVLGGSESRRPCPSPSAT
jgi:malonyl-CoA reductase/3-hydroxypropionate dehydrogenase (NADP+)